MDLVGSSLDIYSICEQLGSGQTAIVYRALIEGTRKEVAVKVLQPEIREDPTFLKRFYREGQICAQINHPNVLRVYQVSEPSAELQYIVTDLIVGINLTQFLSANKVTCPELAVVLILPILKGLESLHAKGIVHRDIKPDNIMIDWVRKRLVITDLGIAQPMDASRLSVVGTIVGSVAFMPPERMRDQPFDHRVDIWAVGTILYLLATGRFPFEATSQPEMISRIIAGRIIPPQEANPMVADELEQIISRCLAVDPNQRYQKAREIRRDLEVFMNRQGLDQPEGVLVDYLKNPREHGPEFSAQVSADLLARFKGNQLLRDESDEELLRRVQAYHPERDDLQPLVGNAPKARSSSLPETMTFGEPLSRRHSTPSSTSGRLKLPAQSSPMIIPKQPRLWLGLLIGVLVGLLGVGGVGALLWFLRH